MDSRDIEKWRIELDSYANVEDGVEYWLARDLMEPMGYTRWENFAEVVKRAKVSCETNKTPVDSHFRDTTKMVTAGFKQARDRARPGILCRADAPPRAHRAALRRDSALAGASLAIRFRETALGYCVQTRRGLQRIRDHQVEGR